MIHQELPLNTRPTPRPVLSMVTANRRAQKLHRARTTATTIGACDCSGSRSAHHNLILERVRLLRYHRVRTTTPSKHLARATAPASPSAHRSLILERVRLLRYHRVRTATPSIDSTGYREGRVVFLAKGFADAGCSIDFVRGRTSYGGANRRFSRHVVNRGCAVGAPIVVTGLGNGVSVQENFCFG